MPERDEGLDPKGFDLDRCFAQWVRWGPSGQHGKYANNYDYHKAVWLLNKEEMMENGFVLVKADEGLVSPIGTLFVERYDDLLRLWTCLQPGRTTFKWSPFVPNPRGALAPSKGMRTAGFGDNQCPRLDDYVDGVNTMAFFGWGNRLWTLNFAS